MLVPEGDDRASSPVGLVLNLGTKTAKPAESFHESFKFLRTYSGVESGHEHFYIFRVHY